MELDSRLVRKPRCWEMHGGQRYVKRCVNLITYQEPIEGIQVWILLGYPSNILVYPSKYW